MGKAVLIALIGMGLGALGWAHKDRIPWGTVQAAVEEFEGPIEAPRTYETCVAYYGKRCLARLVSPYPVDERKTKHIRVRR